MPDDTQAAAVAREIETWIEEGWSTPPEAVRLMSEAAIQIRALLDPPSSTVDREQLIEFIRQAFIEATTDDAPDAAIALADIFLRSGFAGNVVRMQVDREKLARSLAFVHDPRYGVKNFDSPLASYGYREKFLSDADALISAGVRGPVEQPVVTRAQIDAAAMEMLHQVRDGGAGPEARRAFIRSVAREWGLSVEGGEQR